MTPKNSQRAFEEGLSEQESIESKFQRFIFDAIFNQRTDLIAKALDAGLDLNVRNSEGMTPLHYAVALGERASIRLLVSSGRCDYLAQDKYGRYASDIAIEWTRDYAVGRLLSKKQAMQAYIKDGRPGHLFGNPVG